MEFSPELLEKVKGIKSVEDAIRIAKELGQNLSADQAKELLEKVGQAPDLLKGIGGLFGKK